MQCSAVIVAAGSGSRMGQDRNKQWILLEGIPMLARTLQVFETCETIEEIVVVAAKQELEDTVKLAQQYGISKVSAIVAGGKSRQESVYQGLVKTSGTIVLIHDGARPFVKPEEIKAVFEGVTVYGAAAAGMRVKDTIKRVNSEGMIVETPPRDQLWAAATPQGFDRKRLLWLHESNTGIEATDDCMLAELAGDRVQMISCGYQNIKITTPEDLLLARCFLEG